VSKADLLKLGVIAALVGAALLVALRQRSSRALQVGEAAPDFVLASLDGSSVSLHDYRDRVVIVNFWATWCPPCIAEMPSLEQLARHLQHRGVAVVAVSVDEDATAVKRFVWAQQLSFTIALDPERLVASRYGTYKFPETYIIDRKGKLAQKIIGAIDWQDRRITAFVERLAGANPTPQ